VGERSGGGRLFDHSAVRLLGTDVDGPEPQMDTDAHGSGVGGKEKGAASGQRSAVRQTERRRGGRRRKGGSADSADSADSGADES